jgi:hypothetical protein
MTDEQAADAAPEFHREVAEEAVNMALAEAAKGVCETNNDNRGPRVDEYQMVNGTLGEAWCAKFVYWCFQQAALKLDVSNPCPKIFGAGELQKWGEKNKRIVDSPERGDVLIKRKKHAGLVTGPAQQNGTFPSVEGNTWANTDEEHKKEGVYVIKKTRVSDCKFIRS